QNELNKDIVEEVQKSNVLEAMELEWIVLDDEGIELQGTQQYRKKSEEATEKEKEINAIQEVDSPSDDRDELYDSVDGHASIVNISPEGRVVPGATFGGPPV